MPVGKVDWTTHDSALRKMAEAGASASAIAATIPDATRSGVLGRARRIGVSLGVKPTPAAAKPPVEANLAVGAKKPVAPKAAVVPAAPLVPPRVERKRPFVARPALPAVMVDATSPFRAPPDARPLLSLKSVGECRWPYDDFDGTARFACAAATGSADHNVVYCPAHRALAKRAA